jgi:hypothetical protein
MAREREWLFPPILKSRYNRGDVESQQIWCRGGNLYGLLLDRHNRTPSVPGSQRIGFCSGGINRGLAHRPVFQ